MRGRYWVLLGVGLIGLAMWMGYDAQRAYEICVKAGKQSDETCKAYIK